MANDIKNSSVRWQQITIQQLSFVNNLLIGLATGILAFQTNLIFGNKTVFTSSNKWIFLISILSIFMSLAFGLLTALIRLEDFRKTARVARKREKVEQEVQEVVDDLREKARKLGKCTWWCFRLQIGCFCLGILVLFVLVLINIIVR